MKSTIAAGIVALSLVTGVGVAFAVDAARDDGGKTPVAGEPSPSGSPSAQVPVLAGPVRPGAVEPIDTRMSVTEALATGYIEPDTGRGAACQGADFYRWTKPNRKGLDIIALDQSILSIGVSSAAYRTAEGIGVGSTLAEVRSAYRSGLIQVVSDYGQAGILMRDGDRWLGLLFGEATPDTLDDQSTVTFMEVSTGDSPGLLRDGC